MTDRETQGLAAEAKEYVVRAISGVGDMAEAVVDVTTKIVFRTLRRTKATGSDLRQIVASTVSGTVHGVALVGGDVESAAAFIMLGAVRGAKQVGMTGISAVSATSAALVREAAEAGADVGRTARSAMEAAIRSAHDLDVTAELAASAAASGALIGAGEVSNMAMDQVRDVVTRTIAGIRVVITEPFRLNEPLRPQDDMI